MILEVNENKFIIKSCFHDTIRRETSLNIFLKKTSWPMSRIYHLWHFFYCGRCVSASHHVWIRNSVKNSFCVHVFFLSFLMSFMTIHNFFYLIWKRSFCIREKQKKGQYCMDPFFFISNASCSIIIFFRFHFIGTSWYENIKKHCCY